MSPSKVAPFRSRDSIPAGIFVGAWKHDRIHGNRASAQELLWFSFFLLRILLHDHFLELLIDISAINAILSRALVSTSDLARFRALSRSLLYSRASAEPFGMCRIALLDDGEDFDFAPMVLFFLASTHIH
jgi:hypothetical protein